MKSIGIKLWLFGLLMISFAGHSQSLRVVGYEGLVVLQDGSRHPVSGPTQAACDAAFDDKVMEVDPRGTIGLYHGRDGTQSCVPMFIYRSPTAPSYELHPGLVLWPEFPTPPVCLSCPWLEDLRIIEQLYPDHVADVSGYVKAFGIDQYNKELRDLQQRYQSNIQAFEYKMFQLDELIHKQ